MKSSMNIFRNIDLSNGHCPHSGKVWITGTLQSGSEVFTAYVHDKSALDVWNSISKSVDFDRIKEAVDLALWEAGSQRKKSYELMKKMYGENYGKS